MAALKDTAKKLLFLSCYLISRAASNKPSSKFLVVTYHRISDQPDLYDPLKVSVSTFERQLLHLKRNYSIIRAADLERVLLGYAALPEKACLITFDDGWKDNYTHAFPVLKKLGIPALIFITTDFIGTRKLFWHEQLKEALLKIMNEEILDNIKNEWPDSIATQIQAIIKTPTAQRPTLVNDLIKSLKTFPDEKLNMLAGKVGANYSTHKNCTPLMLSWDEVLEMSNNGISFGSHTKSHAILTLIDQNTVRSELAESKSIIEHKINHPVYFIAYPNGNYSNQILEIARSEQYLAAFTCVSGENLSLDKPFELKRLNMRENSADFLGHFSDLFYQVELSCVRYRLKQYLQHA